MTNNDNPSGKSRRRTVRSFVRRTGRLTPGQQRALNNLWPDYGIDYAAQPLDLHAIFGRTAPTVLEIGFGNGETLVSLAARNPDKNLLGVEVHRPGVGHCLLHIETAGIANLRVICHDAMDVLRQQVSRHSLARINLYFPDPWPKKRHHKRRIIQAAFLQLVADKLQTGGTLQIATDWANYAEHIDTVLECSNYFHLGERREHQGEHALDRPTTRFELRGLKKAHKIFDWIFVRN